jgi:hypothetical protein
MNPHIPRHAPLFAFTSTLLPGYSLLTKSSFLAFCTSTWTAAGALPALGHGFCIGGASELLLAGIPPKVIARLRGWTSLAFLLYWRKIEQILPMLINNAYKKKRLLDLAAEMETFHIQNHIANHTLIDHNS